VDAAVATLAPELAEPLRLIYQQRLTYPDVARRLDISPVVLRDRVSRGLRQLGVHLVPS
jgi:DNA-directed RNA polymerase specialized sigma24 family protein